MSTICGSGASTAPDTGDAVRAAVEAARPRLDGAAPAVGLLFASVRHGLGAALAAAAEAAPGIDWLGSSTAGELTEAGRTDGGVAVLLIAWGEATHLAPPLRNLDAPPDGAAEALCAGYADMLETAAAMGRPHGHTLVLGDGMSPRFEPLVREIRRITQPHHPVLGGGAGDDGAFERGVVGIAGSVASRSAVALHVAAKRRWGIGVGQGVRPISAPMTVTRASGNVVHALDGRPPLEVYRDWAAARGEPIGDDLAGFLVRNELGVYLFDEIVRVRAGLAVHDDGSVAFAGEVPEGARVAIVRGAADELVAAAREAAEHALGAIDGPAAGVLVFSCVTRALVLGERRAEEVAAVVDVFGRGVPVAGFSSYGEVARVRGKLDGYHNHTIVVAAIPE